MRAALAWSMLVLLSAGCTGMGRDGGESDDGAASTTPVATPFQLPTGWSEVRDSRYPGLVVAAGLTGGGRSFALDAKAANEGPHTYRVSSVCVDPWSEAMARDGERVQHREPTGSCAAFGLKDFPPGDTLLHHLAWNATVWVEGEDGSGRGTFQPAPAGQYQWSILFQVYQGGKEAYEFDDTATLRITLAVAVS